MSDTMVKSEEDDVAALPAVDRKQENIADQSGDDAAENRSVDERGDAHQTAADRQYSSEDLETGEEVNDDGKSSQGESVDTTVDMEATTVSSATSSQEQPDQTIPREQQAKYEEARKIEQTEVINGAALNAPGRKRKTAEELKGVSTRNYLDETVVPTLLVGMSELARSRPEKPLEWLAKHLLRAQERQDVAEGAAQNGDSGSHKKLGQGDSGYGNGTEVENEKTPLSMQNGSAQPSVLSS